MSIPCVMSALHIAMCAYLFSTVFVRAVCLSRDARADVRLVYWVLGLIALAGIAAPLTIGWTPDAYALALTAAVCAVQTVNWRYWRGRVPTEFLQAHCRPTEKVEVPNFRRQDSGLRRQV